MKTETKTIAEYKAPRCKCVEVHVSSAVLDSSFGEAGYAGTNGLYHDPDEADF